MKWLGTILLEDVERNVELLLRIEGTGNSVCTMESRLTHRTFQC